MEQKGLDTMKGALNVGRIRAAYDRDKSFYILLVFLIAVLVIGYLIPALYFGRPFGTDTYTHIFHAQEMYGTDSLFDFYDELGKKVLNPDLDDNLFNYPFGSWLFIAVLAKVTSLAPDTTAYLFSTLFLVISALSYYIYAGLFLETKSQKVFALLFLFSMPNVVLTVNNYRPSTFVLPFLLFAIYVAYSEEITIQNLFIIALTVFAIALTHTGTLIYLMIFATCFFWLYCFFGRKFSRPLYILASSTFLFFWIAVKLFPHLYQQYATKATLFLTPGNFLAGRFHIFFADDLSVVLYENLFINHQFVYVIIWSAFVFAVGSVLVSVGERLFRQYSHLVDKGKYAVIPVSDMSHSFLSTPFWVGPIHAILGIIGFFRFDTKGKCFAITVILTTVVPAMMQASEGFIGATGALREISYLYLIIPIAAVLGLWYIIPAIHARIKRHRGVIPLLYIVLFSVIIITPVIGNGYYLPSISGEDYIIEGMHWLSETGTANEKVVGYGYRTVPVYTGKLDASYGLAYGTQTRTFLGLLKSIYFGKTGDQVMDFYSLFGARYVLISDKLVDNINTDEEEKEVIIDSQQDLDKIFSSRDFGIYAVRDPSLGSSGDYSMSERVSIENVGSNIEIISRTYKVVMDQDTPTIRYFGTISQNCLEEGAMYDMARISWLGNSEDLGAYTFYDEEFTLETIENQMIYRTVLKGDRGVDNWSSVSVVYTFLPELIRREFSISNDQLASTDTPTMRAYFSTNLFMPASSLVLKRSYQRIEKDVYPSDDPIDINDVYEEFYFPSGDSGIYITYGTTAPYPQYISYKGSTAYDYSSFSVGNFEAVQPGASLHITQYISVGNENLAKQHIQNANRISLSPYPNGIIPIVLCGYDNAGYTLGYGKTDTFSIGGTNVEYTDVAGVVRLRNNVSEVIKDGERGIPYVISIGVSPPYDDILFCEGLRHPQMALYNGEPTGTVILPESEPRTEMLGSRKTREEFFTDWKNVIRTVSETGDMALFMMRSADVENPVYANDFLNVLDYAKSYGLTHATPADIAEHFTNLQQISYNSSFEMDEAVIVVRNDNDSPVRGVTFVVRMPVLDGDAYAVDNGEIRRMVRVVTDQVLSISVDLGPHESKTIYVRPSLEKKHLSVDIPASPKEGAITIIVRDEEGQPVNRALIMIDDLPYNTNEYGNVSVDLRRGTHEITVEKAGYLKQTRTITVSSYVSFLEEMLTSIFNGDDAAGNAPAGG